MSRMNFDVFDVFKATRGLTPSLLLAMEDEFKRLYKMEDFVEHILERAGTNTNPCISSEEVNALCRLLGREIMYTGGVQEYAETEMLLSAEGDQDEPCTMAKSGML